jgi:hypothetical protein
MTDAWDEDMQEPTEKELERAEASLCAEMARARPVPFDREAVRTDELAAVATEDPTLNEALSPHSPYRRGEARISHALLLWMADRKEPTHLLEWWAPWRLLRPDELAEADYVTDLDPLLLERRRRRRRRPGEGGLRDRGPRAAPSGAPSS